MQWFVVDPHTVTLERGGRPEPSNWPGRQKRRSRHVPAGHSSLIAICCRLTNRALPRMSLRFEEWAKAA